MTQNYSVVDSDGMKYKVIFIPSQMRELDAGRDNIFHDDSKGEMGFIWRNQRQSTNIVDLRPYNLVRLVGSMSYTVFSTEQGTGTLFYNLFNRAGFKISQIILSKLNTWGSVYVFEFWFYVLKQYSSQQVKNSVYNTLNNARRFSRINLFI